MGSSHGGNVFLKTKGRFIETKYDILAVRYQIQNNLMKNYGKNRQFVLHFI